MPQLAALAPAYGATSLADLLPGVLAALGAPRAAGARPGQLSELLAGRLAGVGKVAVLLVDGLGWHQLPQASPVAPCLADLAAAGAPGLADPAAAGALRLTAGFPSTTPVSLVTLGTGAVPGAHGVLGFTLRVPGGDRVLNHLRWGDDPDPASWQPVPTVFETAARAGVTTVVASRPQYAGSGLTVAAYRGAGYLPAADPDELAAAMLAALRTAGAPALVYGYHPDLDHAGHVSGVGSPAWTAAAAAADRLVATVVAGLPADAALLVTADHGQLNVPDSHRIDLDADPDLTAGVAVIAGEPRVRYAHAVPGAEADVAATWRARLGHAATVLTRQEAVATGWFGPVAGRHADRIGDVVAVCTDRYALLATAREPAALSRLVGFHGALTPEEMEIPLLVAGPVTGRR